MEPLLIIVLATTVGLGLIRWTRLCFIVRHITPLVFFLTLNILMSIMILNATGWALTVAYVTFLLMALYFFLVPVKMNLETKETA